MTSHATASAAVLGGWSRRRILLLLGAGAIVAMLLLAGLGYAGYLAVRSAVTDPTRPATRPTQAADRTGTAYRDAVAAAPMLAVPDTAAQPSAPAAVTAASMTIPAATRVGPAGVASGFPHTPAGAVGQLAAVEQTVLQAMSIPDLAGVHDAWAAPDAPGLAAWPLTTSVRAFLAGAGMTDTLDPATSVVVTPAAAQVKGVDGPDWVLACVLVRVRATIAADAQMGYGYCERMAWHAGRWMIAPGAPPAAAPSTWPGTDLAARAGWRRWVGGA